MKTLGILAVMAGLTMIPVAGATPPSNISSPGLMQGGQVPQCGNDATAYRGSDAMVTCYCPASTTASGTVWGSGVYTDDSRVCRAARHAGVIPASGGTVSYQMMGGRQAYEGSTRNGVTTSNYGSWSSSFRFVSGNAESASNDALNTPCPVNATQWRGSNYVGSCHCSALSLQRNDTVWGSDIYTDDSNICRAALHSGAIGSQGGRITISMLPGRASYSGSTRSGVASSNYGQWSSSFRVNPAQ